MKHFFRFLSIIFLYGCHSNDKVPKQRSKLKENASTSSLSLIIAPLYPDSVYFVVEGLASTGLSAFDVLRKAPGVTIDNQNTLIVEGKAGARVYIDGKISLLSGDDLVNYLKTLQSTDIEAIEIITQPSSKFDAAGTAEIINLRLKRNKNYGTNGSVKVGYGLGRYGKYNSAFSLNHRTANLNVFSSLSLNNGKNYNYINLNRFQNGYQYDQKAKYNSTDQNYNLRAGANYTINSKNTLGVLLNGNVNSYNSRGNSLTPITNLNSGATEQLLQAKGYKKIKIRI